MSRGPIAPSVATRVGQVVQKDWTSGIQEELDAPFNSKGRELADYQWDPLGLKEGPAATMMKMDGAL